MIQFLISLICVIQSFLISNPFQIDLDQNTLSYSDDQITEKLLQIKHDSIPLLLERWLRESNIYIKPNEIPNSTFYNRLKRGFNWFIKDEENKHLNKSILLKKINKGGSDCIVSLCTFQKDYPSLLKKQIISLKKIGFNGYHLSFWGAFPNPTGKEIRFIAVPYAFKIFAMEYAHKLGFNNILWIDSALQPKKDPKSLLNFIKKNGAYFQYYRNEPDGYRKSYMLNVATQSILKNFKINIINDCILNHRFVAGGCIGLNFEHPLAQKFKELYLQAVEVGFPFASGCTDETVLSALLSKEEFESLSQTCDDFEKESNIIHVPHYQPLFSGKKGLSIFEYVPHRHP